MARRVYVGIPQNAGNMLGIIGNMEKGIIYVSSSEKAYFVNSSQHKFGSSSQAFMQSASASSLTYALRNSSGAITYNLFSTHKYYFSIWVNQRTNLTSSIGASWNSNVILDNKKNSATSTWQQHSSIFSPTTSGSATLIITCNDYPGSNAIVNVDGLMLVDLTETYGVGSEPTKEWCDTNITFTTETEALSGVARKGKKIYIGVNNIARKVKRGYVGVAGVARPFWTGGEPVYWGRATDLSFSSTCTVAMVGEYGLFAPYDYDTSYNINAYNSSLVRTLATPLTYAKAYYAGASTGNYALFAGGVVEISQERATVEAYDTSLTRSDAPELNYSATRLAGANNSNYAFFAGGSEGSDSDTDRRKYVYAYDNLLTKTRCTDLTTAVSESSAGSVGDYVLFAGGRTGPTSSLYYKDIVYAYDNSLTQTRPTVLSQKKVRAVAVNAGTNKEYLIFAGGTESPTISNAYDQSLTRIILPDLSQSRLESAGTTLGQYALIAGGNNGFNSVEGYDGSLTRKDFESMSVSKKGWWGAITLGDYALFGGGDNSLNNNVISEAVEVFVI